MSHSDDRASTCFFSYRLLNHIICCGIDRSRCLIQNKNSPPLQEHPGQANKLSLSHTPVFPIFSDCKNRRFHNKEQKFPNEKKGKKKKINISIVYDLSPRFSYQLRQEASLYPPADTCSEPEMKRELSKIFNHKNFVNKERILVFQPPRVLDPSALAKGPN